MSALDPCFQTAAELSKALRARNFSATELIEAFLARIAAHDARAKAYIAVTAEDALSHAAECDRRLAEGEAASPLLGIPFGTKDLIDIKGLPTTGGSAAMQDNPAAKNADVVERVLAQSAISLGKTNLHEFAYGITGENALYGTPVNAYDVTRLACGSSSGSAAAVAHGLASFALGTDTGGSVRVPAVLNGLVGLKPGFGRISTQGVMPYCWTLDHVGLITRSVGDCAMLFEHCADRPDGGSDDRPIASLKVGIPDDSYLERVDPEILAAYERVTSFLARQGASLVRIAMPDTSHARTVSLAIQMPEALSFHSRFLAERGHLYGADFRAGLALGQYILAEHYVRAQRLLSVYRDDMQDIFSTADVILTPATPLPAPKIGTVSVTLDGTEEPVGNALTRFTAFFNMTGHPAIALPTAMHSLGLPIGVQLVGRHRAEATILAVAAGIEESFGRTPPPNLH